MSNQVLIIGNAKVRQTDSGLYCLNDLYKGAVDSGKATASQRPVNFLRSETAKPLIEKLTVRNPDRLPVETVTGRSGGTYIVKELVYAYAMWVDASFYLQVIDTFDAVARGDEKQALALAGTQAAADRLALLDDELVKQYIGIRKRELRQLEQKANEIRESLGEMDLDAPDIFSQQIEAVIKTLGRRKEAGRTRLSVAELKDGVKNLKVFAGQSRLSTFITSKIMPEVGILGVATFDGKMIWIH